MIHTDFTTFSRLLDLFELNDLVFYETIIPSIFSFITCADLVGCIHKQLLFSWNSVNKMSRDPFDHFIYDGNFDTHKSLTAQMNIDHFDDRFMLKSNTEEFLK